MFDFRFDRQEFRQPEAHRTGLAQVDVRVQLLHEGVSRQLLENIDQRLVVTGQFPGRFLGEMTDVLTAKLVDAGADADTIRIADIEETAVSYMADASTRMRVKMVGDLQFGRRGS